MFIKMEKQYINSDHIFSIDNVTNYDSGEEVKRGIRILTTTGYVMYIYTKRTAEDIINEIHNHKKEISE